MVCEPDETDLDIHIPTVMLPQDAGVELERMLSNRSSSKSLLEIAGWVGRETGQNRSRRINWYETGWFYPKYFVQFLL